MPIENRGIGSGVFLTFHGEWPIIAGERSYTVSAVGFKRGLRMHLNRMPASSTERRYKENCY